MESITPDSWRESSLSLEARPQAAVSFLQGHDGTRWRHRDDQQHETDTDGNQALRRRRPPPCLPGRGCRQRLRLRRIARSPDGRICEVNETALPAHLYEIGYALERTDTPDR